MYFEYDGDVPIYLQVAQQIESGILSGAFPEESQVPSTTEVSVAYSINPATVLKGMTLLVEEGILYKKRGIGMFVLGGAQQSVREKRQRAFFSDYVVKLLEEAKKLQIDKQAIINMIIAEEQHG